MSEKILITKIVKRADGNVDLYERGHRYKDTTLFDAADLLDVGIDPSALQVGVEVPCKFYAQVKESDKLNKSGNPYLDVEYLEPAGGGVAPAGLEGDVTARLDEILRELRRMTALLAQALNVAPVEIDDEQDDGPGVVEDPVPHQPPAGALGGPLNENQAKRAFTKLAGPSIRDGLVDAARVNELTTAASVVGWADSLRQLRQLLDEQKVPA